MPKNTFALAADNLNVIGSNQTRINTLKGDAATIREESQTLKLDSYCQLIAGIADVKLTSKSNLPTAVSASLKGDLMDVGQQTESMANKLVKNAVGARNVFGIHGDNITPEMVAGVFADNEITSEAKLIKAVSGDAEKSKVQLAVEKIVGRRSTKKDEKGNRIDGDKWIGGFTYEEIEEFTMLMADTMEVRRAMEAAAQEAADKVDADNESANEMLDQL